MIIDTINRDIGILQNLMAAMASMQRNGVVIFSKVIVSSKPKPQYKTNEDVLVIYPLPQRMEEARVNDDRNWVFLDYDFHINLNIFNWAGLSELERIRVVSQINNLIATTLYQDRYRGGNAILYDKNLNGTYVGVIEVEESKDVLKGKVRVSVCSLTSASNY